MAFSDPHQMAARPGGMIGAVDNVLRLLALFELHDAIRVNEVARELGLSRSTVHRLLTTLSFHGFVKQNPSSKSYEPGSVLARIAGAPPSGVNLRATAFRSLLKLRDATEETAHLALLRGNVVCYVDCVEGLHAVRAGSRVGTSFPAVVTAAGKAVLATHDDERVRQLLSETEPASTGGRIIWAELLAELEKVRARGYSINDGMTEPDICVVAAAIPSPDRHSTAAITVTVPRSRATQTWILRAAASVTELASQIHKDSASLEL